MRRQIPNLITLGNLLSGVVAVYFSLSDSLLPAALFVCLGIFLDFFDGMAARLLGVASPIGRELDSLADVVTSGIAPGFILYRTLDECLVGGPRWLAFAAFLIPLFSAYRLAKFNLDDRQSHAFLGLPVPSNALIWVGIALWPNLPTGIIPALILIVLSLITNILMISEMPMFSLKVDFKDMTWRHNRVQYIFLIGCMAIIAVTRQWYAISVTILWYITLSAITQRDHAE